ncbi:MAG TPA: lipoate--protein ligase family protein [Thermoguttaceae bacterium]|nr:lipoate--protein ligase family protein [Thermoguttaceae bacterium]
MRYLELALPTAAENVALDEALLEEAEAAGRPTETLRIWEPAEPMVVVGRSSRIEQEVHGDACRRFGVPIVRRPSGGAAIVTGPGCLMYALVLDRQSRGELRTDDRAHRFVLGRLARALQPMKDGVRCRGISDLAVGDLKFSGNSIRRKRTHLLYHGTLLCNFSLDLIDRYLAMPPRQPEYRGSRKHAEFVVNLGLDPAEVCAAIRAVWNAVDSYSEWPQARTAGLVADRYGRREWNEGF